MSGLLKHLFVNPKADGLDTTITRPTDWNDFHLFMGGAHGSLLFRDTGGSYGADWLADVAVGSVLVSGGVAGAPAWSATPTLTSLTVTTLNVGNADTPLTRGAAGDLQLVANQNAGTKFKVINNTSGTGAFAQFSVHAVGGANLTGYAFSALFTTSGRFIASSNLLDGDGANGLGLSASSVGAGITFYTDGGLPRWNIIAAGHLLALTDNMWDIGASGASRPATIYAGTRVVAPAYTVGSTAGVSFGPAAVTSITVVNGIVTAIS